MFTGTAARLKTNLHMSLVDRILPSWGGFSLKGLREGGDLRAEGRRSIRSNSGRNHLSGCSTGICHATAKETVKMAVHTKRTYGNTDASSTRVSSCEREAQTPGEGEP